MLGHRTGRPPAWLRVEKLALHLARAEGDDDRAVACLRGEIQRQSGTVAQERANELQKAFGVTRRIGLAD